MPDLGANFQEWMSRAAFPLIEASIGLTSASGAAEARGGQEYAPPSLRAEVSRDDVGQPDSARRVLGTFATCIVRSNLRGTKRYLQTVPGTTEATKTAVQLTDVCLARGSLNFHEPLLRGSIYEALYRKEFGKEGPTDFSVLGPIYYGVPTGEDSKVQATVSLRHFADCVVRSDAWAAQALVLSPIGEEAETAAFSRVLPHLETCLSEGAELRFSKGMVRGLIAEAMYRLSTERRKMSHTSVLPAPNKDGLEAAHA